MSKSPRSDWKTYRFDEMAVEVRDRVEVPRESGFERYVGLTHLDAGSLKIWRWGSTDEVEKQKMLFKSGDIIFGRRNAYLRRVAVADFDGVCSAHAMVLTLVCMYSCTLRTINQACPVINSIFELYM